MGFFSKQNKKGEKTESIEATSEKKTESKKKSDKSIKPRSPKSMALKKVIRIAFWIFVCFILLKGVVSFAQGTRIIEKVTNIGSDKPAISDSVKGFAIDFASEYFTWNINNVNERNDRLVKFINGVDPDAGLKSFDVKGSSRVLSVDVYNTNKIDESHYDITVVVRREIQLTPAPDAKNTPAPVVKKTYMVVPVTMASKGPVIQTYPRFVAEQQKGDNEGVAYGKSVSDAGMLQKGSELADSFLRSYFDGNVNQLKYFYADGVTPPASITKSTFTLDKVNKVDIYQVDGTNGGKSYIRIDASVLVKNDLGESFVNLWTLNAIEKDGRLYVLSVGQVDKPKSESSVKTPTPSTGEAAGQNIPSPAPTTKITTNQ